MSGSAPQPGATGGLWVARKVELSPGGQKEGKANGPDWGGVCCRARAGPAGSWTSVLSGTVNSGFLISQLMAPSKKTQRGRSKGLTDIAEDFSKDFSLSLKSSIFTFFLLALLEGTEHSSCSLYSNERRMAIKIAAPVEMTTLAKCLLRARH